MNSLILCSHPLSTYRINKCKVAEHTIPYKDWSGNILMFHSFWEVCWVCVFSKLVDSFFSISDTPVSNTIASFQTHTHWVPTQYFSSFYLYSCPLSLWSLLWKQFCKFFTNYFQFIITDTSKSSQGSCMVKHQCPHFTCWDIRQREGEIYAHKFSSL